MCWRSKCESYISDLAAESICMHLAITCGVQIVWLWYMQYLLSGEVGWKGGEKGKQTTWEGSLQARWKVGKNNLLTSEFCRRLALLVSGLILILGWQSQQMSLLIPVLNGRTKWCGKRMSRSSLNGFTLHLPEGPGTHRVQELQPCPSIYSWPRMSLHLPKLKSALEDKIKGVPSVSIFSSKRQEGLVSLSSHVHPFLDRVSTLQGANNWASGPWTSWHLKCRLF